MAETEPCREYDALINRWERIDRAVVLLTESLQAVVETVGGAPFVMASEWEDGAPRAKAARERLGAALIALGKAKAVLGADPKCDLNITRSKVSP